MTGPHRRQRRGTQEVQKDLGIGPFGGSTGDRILDRIITKGLETIDQTPRTRHCHYDGVPTQEEHYFTQDRGESAIFFVQIS